MALSFSHFQGQRIITSPISSPSSCAVDGTSSTPISITKTGTSSRSSEDKNRSPTRTDTDKNKNPVENRSVSSKKKNQTMELDFVGWFFIGRSQLLNRSSLTKVGRSQQGTPKKQQPTTTTTTTTTSTKVKPSRARPLPDDVGSRTGVWNDWNRLRLHLWTRSAARHGVVQGAPSVGRSTGGDLLRSPSQTGSARHQSEIVPFPPSRANEWRVLVPPTDIFPFGPLLKVEDEQTRTQRRRTK